MARVARRASLEAVSDDSFDARVRRRFGDDGLGAGGETQQADAVNPARGQIRDGAADVAVPLPAEGILVPGALAATFLDFVTADLLSPDPDGA